MDKKVAVISVLVFFSFIGILASLILSMDSTVSSDVIPQPQQPNWSKNNPRLNNTSEVPRNTQRDVLMQLLAFQISKDQAIYFIPVIFFTALGTAAVSYYVLSGKQSKVGLDKKDAKKAFLSALDTKEREVIDLLFKNNGSVHQYELTRVSDMNKVQTHRLLKSMEEKGIIKKKKIGKVNRIILSDDLRVFL